jgi:mono/diheme cytochrome c family protein
MRTRLLLLATVLACSAPRPSPPRGRVVLSVEGRVENGPFRFGAEDLPRLPRRAFEAMPPFGPAAESTRFEGLALAVLLADSMEVAREADTAIVYGDAGVAWPVPLPLIRQLRPVLADRAGGEAVGAWRKGAAPLQLAWPNLEQPGIDTDPRLRWWWIGGVNTIVLQSWTRSYGRALRVPAGAGNGARRGASVLGSQCIGCHRIRGMGGTRGPPLTGVEALRDERALAAKLRNHLREVSGMAGAPELGTGTAHEIGEFLEAVRLAGAPDDEPVELSPPLPIEPAPTTRPLGPGSP